MNNSTAKRLEQYTIKHPREVLLVTVELAGEEDKIAIFKGFSSSLMRPTAFDPDVPVLSDKAKIITIDRLASPYDPEAPKYIQKGLSWEAMEALLSPIESNDKGEVGEPR
jgi:hypothetical protein